ncbi:hypothetical protein [Streptomyces celluloflavus]|uniref:hypothetical protein n=1 Tax=Streptomyces celluloflavus TaxID=58344 RepID=UPI0034602E70|nr:hypothetical protein OG717_00100 [Streptomyces celluloflavus]WSK17281.1 hypothetical protein OG717_39375 [Streptomyces celluloflavus]
MLGTVVTVEEEDETRDGPARARLGGVVGPAPGAPPGTVQVVTGTRARQVNDQEAQDFGICTERARLETEHAFYDAENDVLRRTVTVDYSGQPYVTSPFTAASGSSSAWCGAIPYACAARSARFVMPWCAAIGAMARCGSAAALPVDSTGPGAVRAGRHAGVLLSRESSSGW